jgi:hypothetical protein
LRVEQRHHACSSERESFERTRGAVALLADALEALALAAGGVRFPLPVKKGMTLVSRVMTRSSRYI